MELPKLLDSLPSSISSSPPVEPRWYRCPACSEDFNRLHLMYFFNDFTGENDTCSLCISCSETLVALPWVFKNYPVHGVELEMKWHGSKTFLTRVGNEVISIDRPKNCHAIISYGDISFVAYSNGTGTPIKYKTLTDKDDSFAPNVFILRAMIKRRLENPEILNGTPF